MARAKPSACPCGGADYAGCCGPYHGGAVPATAEALMRSRYSAYARRDEAYLRASWHPDTRPAGPILEEGDGIKWVGLEVLHQQQDEERATVEFVARYKLGGRARRLHEISRFVREDGRWLYLDGGHPSAQED